ncbi:MAG TPA: Type 1 glutamine amidotransferase-like domain-containing protein [Actinomycetes bacterium]|nr:Type 1 glutamine amidotransferase-like domain-containing protein [Actinomycetes bacterium]
MSGWFALMGAGEFQPWSRDVDAWMLDRVTGDGRVLVVPTASAPEGDEVFSEWARSGTEHFAENDVPCEVLDVRDRTDADDRGIAERVREASVIYFSGGNPAYLVATLNGTALWQSVLSGLDRGMGYIGCSAGMASLGRMSPDSTVDEFSPKLWVDGLRLFPRTWFGPHWNMLDDYIPGLVAHIEATVPSEDLLIAVDEQTALVGDGERWQVIGESAIHIREAGVWRDHAPGDDVSVDAWNR